MRPSTIMTFVIKNMVGINKTIDINKCNIKNQN